MLVAAYRGIESWFYFDSRGQLTAMEIYADEHADPLEIHFSQYREVDGHDLPGHVVVYGGGNRVRASIAISSNSRRGGEVEPREQQLR